MDLRHEPREYRANRYSLGVVDDDTWYGTVAQLRNASSTDLRCVLHNNIRSAGAGAEAQNARAIFDAASMMRKISKEMMVREARTIREGIASQKKQLRRLTPRR